MRPDDWNNPNYHGQDPRGGQPVRSSSLFAIPALTVLWLVRYPVGNKVAAPYNAVCVTLIVGLFSCVRVFGWPPMRYDYFPLSTDQLELLALPLFVIVCAVGCTLTWAWRFLRLGHKGSIHQQEAGVSWIGRLTPLPLWSTEIFITPGVFGLAGWLLFGGVFSGLGIWLMLCGASLSYLGFIEFRHRAGVRGNITDMHVQGAAVSASVGAYSRPKTQTAAPREYAQAASPTVTPRGVAMPSEGGGGLYFFGVNRKGDKTRPAATVTPSTLPARRGDRPKGTTYAEPGV